MPNHWLLKTEPSTYSWDDLERDKKAIWDGVTNPVALRNIAAMTPGDDALIYHTGDEKAVVGLARVTKAAYPDPKAKDPKLLVVDLEPVRRVARRTTLAEIKADALFRESALVRQGRLSVVRLDDQQFRKLTQP
ncbi:MAG TPA: EVE domain-containing protein [Gemmatimonadaceae bacterium]|nr:EVE domain-containing protein [Gemmatimonadaceae bacterium]